MWRAFPTLLLLACKTAPGATVDPEPPSAAAVVVAYHPPPPPEPVVLLPDNIVQLPDDPPPRPEPSRNRSPTKRSRRSAKVPGGVPGGVVGGVPGGVVGGGGNPPRASSTRRKQMDIAAVMIFGIYTPALEDVTTDRSRRTAVAFCVSQTGKTIEVETRRASGNSLVDRQCRDLVKHWRFRPFRDSAGAFEACTTKTFRVEPSLKGRRTAPPSA